jgi:hypothetical protein
MADVHGQVTKLWNLALADAAFPEEYRTLKSSHPGIECFLVHNTEVVATWWAKSLQAQVRDVGWCLYAMGGIDAMIDAMDAMRGWGSYPQGLGEFIGLVERAWWGIGSDDNLHGRYGLADQPKG